MKFQDRRRCEACDKMTIHIWQQGAYRCVGCAERERFSEGLADLAKMVEKAAAREPEKQ